MCNNNKKKKRNKKKKKKSSALYTQIEGGRKLRQFTAAFQGD